MKHPFSDFENRKSIQRDPSVESPLHPVRSGLNYFDTRALPCTTAQQELILQSFCPSDQARLVSQLAAYSILLRYLDIKSANALRLNYPGLGSFWHASTDMFFIEPTLLLSYDPGFTRLVLAIEATRRKLQPAEEDLHAAKKLLVYSIVLPGLLARLHDTSPVFHFDTQLAKNYMYDFEQQLLNCFSPFPGRPLHFASLIISLLSRWNSKHPDYSYSGPDIDLRTVDPVLELVYPLVKRFWNSPVVSVGTSIYSAGAEVVRSVWPHLSCLIEQDGKICSGIAASEFLSRFGLRESGMVSRDDSPVDTCARVLLFLRTGSDR